MPTPREIRNKIGSVKKIQKITSAMENVAASKMRRAQEHMETSMPYANKICDVVCHIASADDEYTHPFLQEHEQSKKAGYIVVSTDRGLCGGLNILLFKKALEHASEMQEKGIDSQWCLFGKKAKGFFKAIIADVVAHVSNIGETPKVSDLIGSIKVMLDAYKAKELDMLFIVHNEFVSTLIQKPVIRQLLPLRKAKCENKHNTSYIFEPEKSMLIDTLMTRYIETQVYQAVVDNLACEQVARMMAMQKATDNSKDIIEDLQMIYNKARQATITKEISEIVSGAEAV